MRLVVGSLAIAHHSHDIWERRAGTVVLVGVEEDSEALEVIRRSKNRTRHGALFGKPHREPITVQITLPVNLEFNLDLCQK